MKAQIRIPTKEYAYIEVAFEGTEEEMIATHDRLQLLVNDKEGWNAQDWKRIRNTYATKNEITPEDVEGCSKAQKYFINQLKLVFKDTTKE